MKNPLQTIERSIDRDFIALLLAQNRVGAGRPLADLLYSHAIPTEEFEAYAKDPSFEMLVQKHVKELNDAGFGVEKKAAVLHELGLPIVYDILRDSDMPAMARLKAHEMLGDISGKAKARPQSALGAIHNGFQLVINLGDAPEQAETFSGMTITQTSDEMLEITPAPTALPVHIQSKLQEKLVGRLQEYDDEAAAYE